MKPILDIRIQAGDFDLDKEVKNICARRKDIGAVVSFTGLCRDEGGVLSALDIEHYPGMAEAEIKRIGEKAIKRFSLTGLTAIHRYGKILPGENIVLVITASHHRQGAFDGANFLMDYLKTRAPFWKKEHFANGDNGGWVEAKDEDDSALLRWEK